MVGPSEQSPSRGSDDADDTAKETAGAGAPPAGRANRRSTPFWRRRAARQWWLQAALGAVVLVAVAGASITVGVALRQPDLAVRGGLASISADDNSMVWTLGLASNALKQDAATRAQLQRAFRGAPISIASSAVGDPLSLTGGRLVLPLRDAAPLRAATRGMPVLRRGEVAIDDVGASELHLRVGDSISLQTGTGNRTLKVTAVWHAIDSRSPIWNGIGRGASGTSARIAIAPAELSADQVPLTARWSISPRLAQVSADDLPAIEAGFARLAVAPLKMANPAGFSGGGAATVTELRQGIDAAASVVPVAVALLGVGALLAMLLLTRLLTEVRAEETALLRARGASRAQLAGADVRAALAPVLVATVVGGLASQLILLRFVAPPTGIAQVIVPALVPAAVALIAVIASSSSTTVDRTQNRAAAVTGAIGAILLIVVAAIGVYRLLTAGVGADPAADLAPALVIAALVVAGLIGGPRVAAAADALQQRRNGIAAPLAVHRLRWRPGLVVGALVLVALAVGTSGFAASTIPTSGNFLESGGRLATGGDLDVQVPGNESIARGAAQTEVAKISRAAGAQAASPALLEQVQLGDVSTTLVAAPLARMSAMQSGGIADLDALGATVARPIGIALPDSGSLRVGLDVRATSAPADLRVRLTAWIVRQGSGVVRIDLPSAAVGSGQVDAQIPAGGAGRLVALDAAVQSSGGVSGLVVSVRSLALVDGSTTRAVRLPSTAWALTAAVSTDAGTAESGLIGWRASREADASGGVANLGRLMPRGSSVVPIAISRSLATTSGLEVGGIAALQSDPNLPVRIATIVPHTIGASSSEGLWADLPTLQTALLRLASEQPRADHVWLDVADAGRASSSLAASQPSAVITESPAVTFAPLALPVTAGTLAAAAGTLVFALLGIATVVASLMRARHGEIAVLRALGATVKTQRTASRIEFLAVLGYAAVIGAIAAVVSVALTVPSIAHGVAPGVVPAVPAHVAIDPILLGLAILILGLGVVCGLAVQERSIAAAARRPGTKVER